MFDTCRCQKRALSSTFAVSASCFHRKEGLYSVHVSETLYRNRGKYESTLFLTTGTEVDIINPTTLSLRIFSGTSDRSPLDLNQFFRISPLFQPRGATLRAVPAAGTSSPWAMASTGSGAVLWRCLRTPTRPLWTTQQTAPRVQKTNTHTGE